jgi:proteasome lid subunit RPN8/RPN11
VALTLGDGVLEFTHQQLRELSAGVRESMVVWAGRPYDGGALVTHVVAPEVDAHYDRITVPNTVRAELAMFLRREGLLLFADLHTHPGEAYLSPADRARPLSTRPGFYALVVPEFAAGPAGVGWHCYESTGSDWKEVSCADRFRAESR